MRLLVTGGAGFIGSHVVDALVARGDEVTVVDNLSSGSPRNLNPCARFEELDIRSSEAADLVRALRPDGVCHLAAQVSVPASLRDPLRDADNNIMGSLALLTAASEVGSRFVFSSSGGAIYGERPDIPTPETTTPRPTTPYGVGKLAVELYLHQFGVQHGTSYVALRYSNVYGPRQNAQGEAGVVAVFCLGVMGMREFRIHGSGADTRDYLYVDDVVRANLYALDSDRTGHYNIGSAKETDVNTLYRLVADGFGSVIPARHGPPRVGDVHRSAVDIGLVARELGWRPTVSLHDGVRRTVEWFKSHREGAVRT